MPTSYHRLASLHSFNSLLDYRKHGLYQPGITLHFYNRPLLLTLANQVIKWKLQDLTHNKADECINQIKRTYTRIKHRLKESCQKVEREYLHLLRNRYVKQEQKQGQSQSDQHQTEQKRQVQQLAAENRRNKRGEN